MKQGEPNIVVENIASDFPVLENLEAQMALIDIVQNKGDSAIIDKIICKDKESGELSKNIGLKIFAEALQDGSLQVEDVVEFNSSMDLSSEKAQEKWESLENKLGAIKPEQVD